MADYVGFDSDRGGDYAGECGGISGEDCVGVLLHVAEELCVVDDSGLDGLLKSGAKLCWGEGAEDVGVGEDGLRMVEASDEIFPCEEVDAGLAADGGVDLGEEGGGELDVGDAAHVDGGEEAGDVADDSATEGEQEAVAVCSGEGELLGERFDAGHALVGLAGGEEEGYRFFLEARRGSASTRGPRLRVR